ncbi:uncharacterized protein LOC127247027 isoform X2 [Andrographis paniculata]|nr:uncharacterized protein LOC127247027 isoform X2 [Andrographis paniculata]
MATFHTRSNSFPSQSHPAMGSVEDQLNRLKSSEAASTSASCICVNLDGLRILHEGIDDLIQMSSIQQALTHEKGQELINGLLEGSLKLVDLCGFSKEIVGSIKESIQVLESSLRRHKGEATSAVDFNSYVASRNKIKKMAIKYAKSLTRFNKKSTEVAASDGDLNAVGTMLKEAEAHAFSALRSVLMLVSGEKEKLNQRNWSFLSKLTKTSRVHSEVEQESSVNDLFNIPKSQKGVDGINLQNTLKQLRASELMIQELEEGLEALFRSLVKTRVSLLNVLSH